MSRKHFCVFILFLLPFQIFSWPFQEINDWISYGDRDIDVVEEDLPAVLKEFPLLQRKLPYIQLGNFPTEVTRLETLGDQLGVSNLYFKDDGPCASRFGGNKVRKLEFVLADALYAGAQSIITIGGAGSNCVVASLAHAKHVGFDEVYCVLSSQLKTYYLQRNLLLDLFYEGEIEYHPAGSTDAIWALAATLESENKYPYIISWGATCPIGFLGYMNAAFELKEQIDEGVLPEPDYIYVPLGSTGTSGGLILGAYLAGLNSKIVPVGISGSGGDCYYRTENLASRINEAVDFFVSLDPSFPNVTFLASELEYRPYFADYTYAETRFEVLQPLFWLLRDEGIRLEATYSGRALYALVEDLKNDESLKDKTILFWNTFCYGKFDDVTSQVSHESLPAAMHHYFEPNMQPYDLSL